jgi:glycosyltransferase involved in cell wall biosynthesis
MTILHLACAFPDHTSPHNGRFIKEQIAALTAFSSDRHELIAVIIRPGKASLQTKLRRLEKNKDGISGAIYEIHSRFWKSFLDNPPFLLKQFRHLYRQVGDGLYPDLLHSHLAFPTGIVTRQFAKQLAIPYLISDHSTTLLSALHRHPLRQMTYKAMLGAHAIVVPNLYKKDKLTAFTNRHPLPRLTIVPPAVNQSVFEFKPKPIRNELHLVTISPLVTTRRIEMLIDAVAKLEGLGHPCRLTIIGRGPDRSALEARTYDQHAPVRFVGQQTPNQIAVHLNDADAILFPGKDHSYGSYFAEALCTGTPVLVSQLADWKDIVAPGFGMQIGPDVQSWIDGIITFKHLHFDHQAIVDFAKLRYHPEVVAKQLSGLYAEVG